MTEITVVHDPACATSCKVLAMSRNGGIERVVVWITERGQRGVERGRLYRPHPLPTP